MGEQSLHGVLDGFVDTEVLRLAILWHVMCPENDIPDGEEAREVLIDGRRVLGVVPAVVDRRDDDVAQWTPIPVHIGVAE